MSQKLEIYDADAGNTLAFDMRDVLQALPASVRDLAWYLLELEAMADSENGQSEMELEDEVHTNPNGLKLSWGDLQQIASRIGQTINAVLVALSSHEPPPSLPLCSEYPGRFVIIEAIDSSLWATTSNDTNVIESLQQHFHDTKIVSTQRA